MNLDINIFEIKFETKCLNFITDEIPDWYISKKVAPNSDTTQNTENKPKILIGMNQLDLWSGGHQTKSWFKIYFGCKI